jgi:hypothetical protein
MYEKLFYNTTWAFRLIDQVCKESERARPLPEPRIPLTLCVPDLWRSSFASSLLQDHCYHSPHPSLMSNNVETYFVRGKAPVTAVLDSLIIMHVGSTSRDKGLLLEARKRYIFAINSLRLDTTRTEPEMSLAGLLMVAMCILLSEVLSPSTCCGLMNVGLKDRRYSLLTILLLLRFIHPLRKGCIHPRGSVRWWEYRHS